METRTNEEERELNTLLRQADDLQKKKAKLELELAGVQSEINYLCQTVIPEVVSDCEGGAPKGFLSDGRQWEVEKKYSVSQPKATKELFHQWLDKEGFGNLVKRKAIVDLGITSQDQVEQFKAQAKEAGYEIAQETAVAPATCKKWVVDRIKAGKSVPDHLVSVHAWYQVKFKPQKDS